jgi:hypothetical protein
MLVGNKIGPEGASKLSEALIKIPTLHILDLSGINSIYLVINSIIINLY